MSIIPTKSGLQWTGVRDKNGREVAVGDLLRTPHYIDRRTKRKCYLYHVVFWDDKFKAARCFSTSTLPSNDKDGNCLLSAWTEATFEIIDGRSYVQDDRLVCWYEREKVKQ